MFTVQSRIANRQITRDDKAQVTCMCGPVRGSFSFNHLQILARVTASVEACTRSITTACSAVQPTPTVLVNKLTLNYSESGYIAWAPSTRARVASSQSSSSNQSSSISPSSFPMPSPATAHSLHSDSVSPAPLAWSTTLVAFSSAKLLVRHNRLWFGLRRTLGGLSLSTERCTSLVTTSGVAEQKLISFLKTTPSTVLLRRCVEMRKSDMGRCCKRRRESFTILPFQRRSHSTLWVNLNGARLKPIAVHVGYPYCNLGVSGLPQRSGFRSSPIATYLQ